MTRFQRWKDFHSNNPEVFRLFSKFANDAIDANQRVGARMIGERIRWYSSVETVSDDGFKVNDHFWPYYARLLAWTDHRFFDYFEFRDERFDATPDAIVDHHLLQTNRYSAYVEVTV